MRKTYTRTAAALAALAAGGLAVVALRPADKTTATLAANTPPVEVRTQVITRTVHVTRHVGANGKPLPRRAVAAGSPGFHGAGSAGGPAGGKPECASSSSRMIPISTVSSRPR